MLKLYLLGPPRVEIEGAPLPIKRRKALALLVYLAATGRPHSREALATLFYPELDQSQARAYFRRDLGALNAHIGSGWLQADRETVFLDRTGGIWIDSDQFRTYLSDCRGLGQVNGASHPACVEKWRKAAELYTDGFLAGFTLPDAPAFDEWQFFEAENLQLAFAGMLEQFIDSLRSTADYDQALQYARRLVQLDPLNEAAQRKLIGLYAQSGQRSAALRQYDVLTGLLKDSLGVSPDKATEALYEAVRLRRIASNQPGEEMPAVFSPSEPPAPIKFPRFLEESAPAPEDSPFVARERELSKLSEAFDSMLAGHGQVFFVTGGAGSGKSTLLKEFSRQAQEANEDLVVAFGYCNAITGVGDPYLPFREALNLLTGDVEARKLGGMISREQARRLWGFMPATLPALVEHGPDLINSLVPGKNLLERARDWASPDSRWFRRLTALNEDSQRAGLDQKQIFSQYAAFLQAISVRLPILLVIEDLHWVDNASSGLLFHLSRELESSRILVIGTYRPEEVPLNRPATSTPGNAQQHPLADTITELKRRHGNIWLDVGMAEAGESRLFIDAYLDRRPNKLDEGFRQALLRRTDGNALFIVELLQTMKERGDLLEDSKGCLFAGEAVDWSALPAKIEGVIEKRIQRLPEDLLYILTAASIEGEIFSAEVVARVTGMDPHTLVRRLGRELDSQHRLVKAQAMKWLDPGRQRLSEYRFRHQLFQDYLYNRLDPVERRYYHEAVGSTLEQLYAGRAQAVAPQLAWHFEQAGLLPRAIDYLRQAGESAAAVSAHAEAAAHFARAIELAQDGFMKTEDLAYLFIQLGQMLLVTMGDGAPEVGEAYGRAYELYQQAGESAQLFFALRGLSMHNKFLGKSETAFELTGQMVLLARRLEDPVLILESSFAMGSLLYYAGEHRSAQAHLERGLENYDPARYHYLDLFEDQDPGVALLSYASINLWLLGYPDQAVEKSGQALALARELSHPYSLAMAEIFAGWVHLWRRDLQMALEHAQSAVELAEEHGFPLFEGVGNLQAGRVLSEMGEVRTAIPKMREALKTIGLTMSSKVAGNLHLSLLVDALARAGQVEEGMQMVDQAIAELDSHQYHLLDSELFRLRGKLILLGNQAENEAETSFQRAIEISQGQGAASLELRSTLSLCRLWMAQGRRDEAHQALAGIYGWFTEGSASRDLQDAKALLSDLSG